MIKVSRRWLYGVLAVVAVVSFLAIAPPARAQTPAPNGTSVEIVGMVRAVTATTLMVNGLTVDISHAEVKTALRVGLKVKVEGFILANGTVAAREVELAAIQDRIRTQLQDCTQTQLQDCPQLQDRIQLRDRIQTQQQDRISSKDNSGQDDPQGKGDDHSGGSEDRGGHHGGGRD